MCCDTRNAVIRGFSDKLTAEIFTNRVPKGFPTDILASARRKLAVIDAAETLNDLRSPPGNRLEALQGNRAGQHLIRINSQWRVCFVWKDDGPHEVEIVDYHG
ncbi:MAG: type II toxin-antitoxin system RelE/ParE family toxin [Acidocella sp.]|nr:type II toxin-antitoxin system RelE/ParE family toxin [Acidocella sp.]